MRSALEDADLALLLVDTNANWQESDDAFAELGVGVPAIVVLNKIDRAGKEKIKKGVEFFSGKRYCKKVMAVSALSGKNVPLLLQTLLEFLPEAEPFYDTDDISDLQTRFFVGELIREKIFDLAQEEVPYHSTVLVREYLEKTSLVKIVADIIVQRETQKAILIGEKGSMIKKIGTEARKNIEAFIGQKVFLELFVKVRPKWRESETLLKEYGY